MKKFNFLGALAFALLLSLNAGVLMDHNNWESSEEIAEAQVPANLNLTSRLTAIIALPPGRTEATIPCIKANGWPGLKTYCPRLPYASCTPTACF